MSDYYIGVALREKNCDKCNAYIGYTTSVICQKCRNEQQKKRSIKKRKKYIGITSFLVFPLGIIFYLLWRNNKPYYAKSGLIGLIPFVIFALLVRYLFS